MYREMKDSGVEWIGKIPVTWNIAPIGYYLKERNEKVSDKDFQALSVTKQGIMNQLENVAKTDNNDNRKKVCKGDFVINSRSDRKQSCGLSKLDGSVSVINIVLENKGIEEEYLKYVLKNYGFAEEFYRWGSGIVLDLWSTKYEKIRRIMIPIPPNGKEIGIYIDKKVSQIDDIISKQKSLIEKYKSYKQSLITETVTKGLNKNVPMKDSGVEWIGEIPSHWEKKKIKSLTKVILEKVNVNKLEVYLGLENVESWSGKIISYGKTNNLDIEKGSVFYKGNLLFGKLRPYLAKCVIAGVEGICSDEFLVLQPLDIDVKLLKYMMLNKKFIDLINSFTYGVKMPRAKWDLIGNIELAIADIEEQREIVCFLDKKCKYIDSTISKKEQLIEKLESYKKSLIYECVTGKREVN